MKVTPKTEIEVKGLLDDGIYNAEVVDAKDTYSKAGNEMLVLELKVHSGKGDEPHFVTDYLLAGAMEFKIRHFCKSAGIGEYEDGAPSFALTPELCIGKTVSVVIGTDEANGKYRSKNSVRDYMYKSVESAAATNGPDDDLPF